MKKIFVIFTVLFTCALPVSGFGDVVTNNRKEFDQFTNRLQNQVTGFTSNLKQYGTDFQTRNQQEYADFEARRQQKFADFEARRQQKFADFETRSQQEISNFRKRSDDKIAEIKRKSAEAFKKLEQAYNDFIKGTPFENCIPGWSYLECKQVNNLSKSTWSCKLKSGITAQKMSSDVEAYCATKTNAFEYDPLEDFEEPENEENDTPIRMTGQTEELSSEDEVTAYDEHDYEKTREKLLTKAYSKYCDDEGYTPSGFPTHNGANYADQPKIDCTGEKGKVILNCYKRKDIRQSLNQDDLKYFCSPDKITNFIIETVPRPSSHIRKCNANEKKAINATNCKISAGGKYSDIECDNQKGYWLNATSTACEKSGRQETNKKCTPDQLNQLNAKSGKLYYYAETPNTQYCGITKCNDNYVIDNSEQQEKCVCPTTNNEFELKDGKCVKKSDKPNKTNKSAKSELIKISGIVIEATTSGNEQTIGGVRITYDEGKKDQEGKTKYARHQTGNNGRFAINIVPGSTITFTHKMYDTVTKTYSSPTSQDEKILMSPTDATIKDRNLQALCEENKKGTWIKTSGKCNCKGQNTIFDATKGCVDAEEFKFAGVVQDAEKKPIPDVKVKYGNQSTTTDAEGKFTLNAPKDTEITFSYKGYENQTYTLTANTTNQTITMEPTEKSANNAKKKALCEAAGPNKGKWNEAFKTCNCKGKAFFDEDEGCVESTEEYRKAEDALKTLYEQFEKQLETIQPQPNE